MAHTASDDQDIGSGAAGSGARREQHDVKGEDVIGRIKELVREGNVRHVVIKNEDGRTLIEFPVTVGVAGALLAPVWAAVGAIAAMVAKLSIEVEREAPDTDEG